jgi:flagellar motor protein MotB
VDWQHLRESDPVMASLSDLVEAMPHRAAVAADRDSGLACPVCPLHNVPSDATSCPNCRTDLGPLRKIHGLPSALIGEAITLARHGDAESAIEKLYGALSLGSSAGQIRSLIARILWRMGRRQDAVEQWHAILRADPGDRITARLVRTAEKVMHQRRRQAAAVRAVGAAVIAAVVLGLTVVTLTYRAAARRSALDIARLETLQRDARGNSRPMPSTLQPITDVADRLKGASGLAVEPTAGGVAVGFEEGLFAAGSDRLSEDGRFRLAAVARALNDQSSQYDVIVEGRTDSTPASGRGRWSSNLALGLARAHAATEFFVRQVTNPGIRLYATSSGDVNPRFANDTNRNRQRNRTVIIRVSRPLDGSLR